MKVCIKENEFNTNYHLVYSEEKAIEDGYTIVEIPKGYEGHLAPRSSTFKTWGLIQTNSIGIVDNSYCGDEDMWRMPVYATRDTVIHVNDRIAQFRIIENQPKIVFEEVESLGNDSRGGFGSTGKQ